MQFAQFMLACPVHHFSAGYWCMRFCTWLNCTVQYWVTSFNPAYLCHRNLESFLLDPRALGDTVNCVCTFKCIHIYDILYCLHFYTRHYTAYYVYIHYYFYTAPYILHTTYYTLAEHSAYWTLYTKNFNAYLYSRHISQWAFNAHTAHTINTTLNRAHWTLTTRHWTLNPVHCSNCKHFFPLCVRPPGLEPIWVPETLIVIVELSLPDGHPHLAFRVF